jgi:YggT family protein
MVFLALLVHRIIQILTIVIIVQSILTFFMSPFHPLRQALDRFVEPMLMPIRRYLPTFGGLDFSPWILIILLQVLDSVLTRFLLNL